jgi:hypothetical protein
MAYVLNVSRLEPERVVRLLEIAARMDIGPKPGGGGSRMVPLGKHEPAARELIWDGPWHAIQFVALYPSRQIVAHCDPPIVGRRFHIPLAVNDGCWSFHDGVWQQLKVGLAYEMDPTIVHGAVNWGVTTRLHLMIDTES